MASFVYEKQLDIRDEVDVLVVGGGPAGCAAAWAAAKGGAKVFVAEALSCLGGLGTAGLVPAFMQFGDGERNLAAGFGGEVLERLKTLGEKTGEPQAAYEIRAESLKRVCEDMLAEAGVAFSFHTSLVDVVASGEHIDACVFAAKSGVFAIKAKVYVDATGDGDLCAWAGAPWEMGDDEGSVMAATLCQIWTNIDWSRVVKPDGRRLDDAFADGVFTVHNRHVGIWKISELGLGGGNAGHLYGVDGTDERSLTKGLIEGRKLNDELRRYFREYLTGYEKIELAVTGSMLGVRETRRIVGEEKLVLDHFRTRAVFGNEIGRYAYPVDAHPAKPGEAAHQQFHKEFTTLRYQRGESYGIPYGALVPRKLDNALVAGRCVSADHLMQSSIRVIPGCYITGQAAGAAAAISASTGVRPWALDARGVQKAVSELGGYLPNY